MVNRIDFVCLLPLSFNFISWNMCVCVCVCVCECVCVKEILCYKIPPFMVKRKKTHNRCRQPSIVHIFPKTFTSQEFCSKDYRQDLNNRHMNNRHRITDIFKYSDKSVGIHVTELASNYPRLLCC